MFANGIDDVEMAPKPVPTGEDEPPGSGGDTGPVPPAETIIDNPLPTPDPETDI